MRCRIFEVVVDMKFDRDIVAGDGVKFGVLKQHFNREFYLVDDSLSRSVTTVEQFEVFDSVVGSNTIDVMDGLLGEEVSTNVLRHNEPVLEHRVFNAGDATGHGNPHVAVPLGMFLNVPAVKARESGISLVFSLALAIAKSLIVVKSAARSTAQGIFFAALLTGKCVTRFRGFATAVGRAFHSTVKRVTSEFFAVGGRVGLLHHKRFVAFGACKLQRSNSRSRATMFTFIGVFAALATVLPISVLRLNRKYPGAVFADYFNRHGYDSSVGHQGIVTSAFV